MDEKLNAYLVKTAPTLFRMSPPRPTPFAERGGVECGDGWYDPLFRFAVRALSLLRKCPEADAFYVSQVKQKFGRLCIYLEGPIEHPLYEQLSNLAAEAESKATELCEFCGAPGKPPSGGYLWVGCRTHIAQYRCEGRVTLIPHTWEKHYVDGGPVGGGDFWECTVCSASGGPAWGDDPPTQQPFLAGLGSEVSISRDCVEAKRQIDEIQSKKSWVKRRLIEAQHSGQHLIDEVKKCYGIEMKRGRRGILYGGFHDKEGRAFELKPKEFRSALGWEMKLHDGTTREFTYYNPMSDWLHEFYGPAVFGNLVCELQNVLGPRGFTITQGHGRVYGAIYGKDDKGRDTFEKAFWVQKSGRFLIRVLKTYPQMDEEVFASSVDEVCKVLLKYMTQ